MPYYLLVSERTEANGTLTSKNSVAIHSGKDGELPDKIIDVPTIDEAGLPTRFKWEIGGNQDDAVFVIKRLPIPDGLEVSDGERLSIELDLRVQGENTIAGSGLIAGGLGEPSSDSMAIFVKDRERVLFTTADGFACTTIYFSVDVGKAKITTL